MKCRPWISARLALVLTCLLTASALAQRVRPPVNPPHTYDPPDANYNTPPGAAPLAHAQAAHANFVTPNTASWTALGPSSLNNTGANSGRMAGVAVDLTNANNIYIAAAGGGVWQSTDGGSTYNPLTDNQPTLSMGAITIAPTDHRKIYAGTGEANNSADSNYGLGILVSNDGGATWTLSAGPSNIFKGVSVSKIAVDPTNENIAYAAINDLAENGTYGNVTGVYKTADGGVTWANTTSAIDPIDTWSDVAVDPSSPNILYAAVGAYYGVPNNGVYRSTNGGSSWALLANVPSGSLDGRIVLAVAPSASVSGAHVLYVAINNPSTYALYKMLRSDNADATTPTFTDLTSGTPNFSGGQGWYNFIIGVDPSNSANVYAAGSVTHNVIRSTNSGVSWTDISTVNSYGPHTDSHAMAFDSSNRLLLGNDGGLWRFDPASPGWTDLNGNLNTIQFTGIGMNATMTGTVVGGSQDNGTELTTGNPVWLETQGGDGGYSQISQTNPSLCYSNHPIGSFGSAQFFQVSTDACNTFSSRTPRITSSSGFDFYSPIFVDPLNGNRVFLGGDALYESTTAGTAWTTHSVPASPVDAIAVLPGGQTLYIATGGEFATSSKIYVSPDDGTTWVLRSLPSPAGRVQEIDLDPNDSTGNTAVAVINTFNSGNAQVYRTIDAGTSWTDITGNLAVIPTWSARIDSDSYQTIYVSNEQGVYSSRSPYGSWTAVGTGLPHAQAVHLELNSTLRVLSVATHGRGAWYIAVPTEQIAFSSASSATFTAGTAGTFTITAIAQPTATLSESGTLPGGVTLVDNGNDTATLAGTPAAGTGGAYPLTLTAQNGVSQTGTQNFTLTVDEAPAFTSANHAAFAMNTPVSFTVTTTGYPAPALSVTGTLPSGVTFTDNGNGTGALHGTPAATGTFNLTFSANNAISPAASQPFTLSIAVVPTRLVFTSSTPASSINAGGNPGNVSVALEDASGNIAAGNSTAVVTLTVTYPNSTTKTYMATASAGIATFSLGTPALTLAGTYTYSATASGLTSANATETVNAGPFAALSLTGLASQPAPGVTQIATVTALDSYGNAATSFTGTVTLTSTDPGATLPAPYTYTAANAGVATFNISLNTAGTRIVTATSSTVTASASNLIIRDAILVINSNGTLSRLTNTGFASSPSAGYTGGGAPTTGTAIDAAGNIFSVNKSTSVLAEFSKAGYALSGSGYTGGGINAPTALAVDGLGFIWVANGNGTVSSFTNAGSPISPGNGYTAKGSAAAGGIAIDLSGNVWITTPSANTLTEIVGGAAPVAPLSTSVTNATTGARP